MFVHIYIYLYIYKVRLPCNTAMERNNNKIINFQVLEEAGVYTVVELDSAHLSLLSFPFPSLLL